jgi:hypothetical protein
MKRRMRTLLLAGTAFALTLAAVMTPPAARALTCPEGTTLVFGVTYYTDSTHRVVFCTRTGCGYDDCNGQTTPYYSLNRTCCPN